MKKKVNASHPGQVHKRWRQWTRSTAKALFRVATIMETRMQWNRIVLDRWFCKRFLKKLSSKVWKFRNNWTCLAGVINRMIVQEFSQLVTKQPDCILQELHCVTNSSERKHSGKLTPYSRNTSVSELHCDITFKALKRYWTACPLPGYQGFQAACVGWN